MPVIANNLSSLYGLMYLKRGESMLERASQRLSSGRKLNSAADDAAGLSIATRMTSQIRGLNMAIKNSNDGISMVSTTESALVEISNMLQRMRELAVQSSNDTNSGKDRSYLQNEINQLKTEITSISQTTQFNGTNVLDGTLSGKVIQTGMNSGQTVSVSINNVASSALGSFTYAGSTRAALTAASTPANNNTTGAEDIIIHGNSISKTIDVSANNSSKTVAAAINAVNGDTGVSAGAKTYAKLLSTASSTIYSLKINGTSTGNMSISSSSVSDAVSKINQIKGTTGVTASASSDGTYITLFHSSGEDITVENESAGTDLDVYAVGYDGTSVSGAKQDLAASGGNDSIKVIGTLKLNSSKNFSVSQSGTAATGYFVTGSASLSSISNLYINTISGASAAMETIDGALEKVLSMRSQLGALQNRLERTVNRLTSSVVTTEEARSRIVDADYALETTRLTKAKIMQQASTAMLAQANQSKQNILTLLNIFL